MAQGRSPPKSPHRTPSRTHAAEGCTRASRAAARDSRSHTQPQRHSRSRTQPQAHFTGSLSSSSSPRSLLENLSYREADEESNIQWIERRRGRNGNEESNEHTRRMLRRRSEFEEEEEGIKKETLASRICRAAKVVSGFLISMGLVLVFYVIITTIMGEKSPLDIFNFDLETDDLVERRGNFTDPTLVSSIAKRNPGDAEGEASGFPVRSLTIEGFGHASNDAPDRGKGAATAEADGDLLYYDDYVTGYEDGTSSASANGTLASDPEGRSYVAYIPVPLNNEEEEEDYEDEDDDEEKRSSNSNPVFVPVMIMPEGGAPGMGGMGPQFTVQNGRPPPPPPPGRRPPPPPFPRQPPRRPLPNRHPDPLLRLPLVPAGRPQQPRMPLGGHSPTVRNPPLNTGTNSRNAMNMNGGMSNMPSRFSDGDFYGVEGNTNVYNMNLPSMNNGMNNRNIINNINSGMRNMQNINSVNRGITANRNMNGANGANRNPDPGNPQAPGHTAQDIWNSLADIMTRPSGSHLSPSPSRPSVTPPSGGVGPRAPPGAPPRARVRPPPMIASRGPGRPLGPPPPLPPARRVRPRLLPKSRMSGPLPKPRPPRPHYRRPLLPPIPPPPGMPIVRRRQPRPAPAHRPPRDFQYPRDSDSIQDIIRYMRDQDQRQGESKGARLPPGFSIGSQDHVVGHNGFKPNSGFTVGSQDHIIGSNPFGDTLSNINIQSQSDVGFGNIQQTGGEKFNNNYNFNSGGGSNFNNGGGNNFGGGGNGVRVSGGGGIPGFNSGSNSGGNYINNGGNNLNSGGNFNNGGNNFNNGDHNFNNGGGNFNNGGNSFNGGSGMSVIPPVHNTHDRGTSKSRPFNIMLDVYPMDDRPVPSGSRPFQTSISFNGGNGRFDSDSSGGRFSGGSSNNYHNGINENNYNSGNSYNGNGFNNNNGNRYNDNDRFSNRDDANKHEVILHLNLFSKSPLSIRRQGTVDDFASGRSGAVSVELPLTGQLSPLDVYKAIISKARTSTAQAQVQLPPGADTDSRDEVEIELFDVEEGPRLLQAIEFGLQELNPSLPPDLRFVFDRSPASASDLHEAVNGEDTGPSWNSSASSPNNDEMWPSLSWPAAEYDHNDDYTYYDYYEYEDYVADAVDTETTTLTTRTTTTTETTTSGSQTEKAELLPTPCWHSAEDGKSASGAS